MPASEPPSGLDSPAAFAPAAADPQSPFVGYVGLITRAVALVLDVICIDLGALILSGAVKLLLSLVGASGKISVGVIVVGGFAWFLWASGYFIFFWSVTGQTPGARLMGFRVVTRGTFEKLGIMRSIRRMVGFYLSAIPFGIGFLPVLIDAERRGWLDRIAGTVVRWSPPDWAVQNRTRRRSRTAAPKHAVDPGSDPAETSSSGS